MFLALSLAVQHELLLGGVRSELSVPEKPNKLFQTPAGAAGASLVEQRSLGGALFGDTPTILGVQKDPAVWVGSETSGCPGALGSVTSS